MTGRELYRRAVALLGQDVRDVTHYEGIALEAVNQLLADYLWEQNALCEVYHRKGFVNPPELLSLDDAVPYQERMVRECFPYGLAALLVADEDREEYNRMMDCLEKRMESYRPCCETELRGTEE